MRSAAHTLLHPLDRLAAAWAEHFGLGAPRAFFAPGRVNLLGAHLDYNEGFVLPMAVDRGTYVLAAPRADRRVRLHSLDRQPAVEADLDGLVLEASHGWANYPKGVLSAFARDIPGLDLLYCGDLPIGAGLSSSASILVATATAANAFAARERSRIELVHLCRGAEVNFVGVKCGIMDHYASAFGREGHVLHLDCRSITHREVPFDGSKATIVVCDTTKRRENSDGRFNDRVRECGEAVARLRELGVPAGALRDVDRATLEKHRGRIPEIPYRRALHVVTEIERTIRGVQALDAGDFEAFGAWLRDSHESCRVHYEVSSRELDALVEAVHGAPGAYGARLTGAGFGGCCVAVVRTDAVEAFRAVVAEKYEAATGLQPRLHPFHPSRGATAL